MFKRIATALVFLALLGIQPYGVLNAAATLDQSVCSTADKAGGNPALCDGLELIESANQELSRLYQGTVLVVQSVGGTADAITGSTLPVDTALNDGDMRQIKPAANNTGPATYNDNGLGVKQVVSAGGLPLSAGDLQSTTVYLLRYYQANDEWRVLSNLGTGSASASNPFVTIGNTGSFGNERALAAGNCTTLTDGGANSTASIALGSCSSANLSSAVTDETGTGAAVFANSPALVTPSISSAGMTFNGSSSGSTTVVASATASGTLTLPAATDTLIGKATTDALTNKTFDTAGTGNSLSINGVVANANTGTGAIARAVSPSFTTPTLGVASATTVNKVTITAPETAATLTIPNGVTLTGPAASGTAMTLGNNETVTGVKTFGAVGNVGKLAIAGNTSGSTVLNATAAASGTLTLPAATDTLVGKATTDTFTNKTYDTAGTGNSFSINGVVANANTGTGAVARAVSPSFTTPALGTPSAVDLTNATNLPVATGISGLGSGVGTFLATPSTANFAAAVTGETGTGAVVFGTSPSLTTPNLGTPSAATLTNATGLPVSTGISGLGVGVATWLATPSSANLAAAISDETGTGLAVFATSPALTTPNIGVATATSVNKVAITAPATAATLTIPNNVTLTGPAASGTVMTLGNNETVTGVKTFGAPAGVGKLAIAGNTSGSTVLNATAAASGTLTLPAATDTLVGRATTDTLTNKTFDTAGAGNSFSINGVVANANTGTGAVARAVSPSFTTPALGTPSSATLTNATGLPISTGVSGLGVGVATVLATPSSANLRAALTDEIGTGAAMFGLISTMADDLGCNASQYVARNSGDTGFECVTLAGGGDALTSNPLSQFAATTSLQLKGVISDETGSGAAVFATSPALVTPDLGTPSAGTLTNATGLPISTGISGLGTGVATALGVNVGTAGAPVVNGGALGTPSSGTLTNSTGLPISTGVSGLGSGVATALATPSSANFRSALTDEVGTGAMMFGLVSTMADDLSCTASQVVRRNSGDTAFECATVSGTGDMVAANNLSDVANAATAFSNIKQAATTSATGVVELATVAEATTGTDTTRAITADGLAAAIAANSTGLKYIGQVAGATTDVNLALGGTYSKIVLVGSVFRSGAGNATVAVSDDGTTFGTAVSLNATGNLFSMSLGSVEISGTKLAATNKTITPSMVAIDDVDGGTGSSTVFNSGGTETSETGVTTHLRFDSTNFAVAYQWTVYGVP